MRKLVLSQALALLTTYAVSAEQLDHVGRFVDQSKRLFGLPYGTALAVVKDDEVIYQHYSGYADIEAKTKVDADTIFYTASVTKPLFALNVLISEHNGKLDTTAPLPSLYPNLRFENLDVSRINASHLLSHTSAINPEPMVWPLAYTGLHDIPLRQRLLSQITLSPDSAFGEYDYSNVGYTVLSVWYDQQQRNSWQDSLDQQVYAPLGMTQTSSRMSDIQKQNWTFARPYSISAANPEQALYLTKKDNTMHAAGGTITTANDLAQVLIAQLNKGQINGKQVIPAAVIQKSHQPLTAIPNPKKRKRDFTREHYSWGWNMGHFGEQRIYHHGGGFAGASAHVSFMPDKGLGVVLLNNDGRLGDAMNNLIAQAVYKTLLENDNDTHPLMQKVEDLKGKVDGFLAHVSEQRRTRLGQSLRLSLPLTRYTGTYTHPLAGTITVTALKESLNVNWGNLRGVAEFYDKEEHVRLELVPEQGKVMGFEQQNGIPQRIRFADMLFTRE